MNVSKVSLDEAFVKVEGLSDDILLLGLKNQNRAISGDIVCIQILPDKEWVGHFKESEPTHIIDKQAPA